MSTMMELHKRVIDTNLYACFMYAEQREPHILAAKKTFTTPQQIQFYSYFGHIYWTKPLPVARQKNVDNGSLEVFAAYVRLLL